MIKIITYILACLSFKFGFNKNKEQKPMQKQCRSAWIKGFFLE